jgi:hypothetical protein
MTTGGHLRNLTWGEFKQIINAANVPDDVEIDYVDFANVYDKKDEPPIMEMSENLIGVLRELKIERAQSGRLWAIGVTDAEKLYAWIGYVIGTMDDSTVVK